MPLASIDNPEARALITTMKAAVKDGRRRFSDSSISYYFRIMRQVISSQIDEKFRPVHRREWNLAAIGLGHSNPSMGDRYGKQLVEDVKYRQEQVEKVGLGLDLPPSLLGLHGLQTVSNVRNKEAA
jgi:hypothetical protein